MKRSFIVKIHQAIKTNIYHPSKYCALIAEAVDILLLDYYPGCSSVLGSIYTNFDAVLSKAQCIQCLESLKQMHF